jgi:hypothetical protein
MLSNLINQLRGRHTENGGYSHFIPEYSVKNAEGPKTFRRLMYTEIPPPRRLRPVPFILLVI